MKKAPGRWMNSSPVPIFLYALCFDLGAVPEGHPDVVLAVNGDVVHHRQPVGFPELRQRLPAPQLFQVGFILVPSARALGN